MMRNKFLPFVLMLSVAAVCLSSCQQRVSMTTAINSNQSNKSISTATAATASPTASATVAPTVSGGNNSIPEIKAKYYDGKGMVTKINLEIGSVELDHDEIKGLMPRMIMEFYVRDAAQLKALRIGDKVDFVLEDKGGAERIFDIKKAGKQKRQ